MKQNKRYNENNFKQYEQRSDQRLSAPDLYTFVQSCNDLRKVRADCATNQNGVIIDISLKFKLTDEDEIFARHKIFHENITRGLALLDFNNHKAILRRGLKKFFDVYYEYLDPEVENAQVTRSQLHNQLEKIVLGDVREFLKKHQQEDQIVQTNAQNARKIIIYQSEKANGENAQISYSKALDAWVFCSKCVTLDSKTPEDLTKVTDPRYNFAVLIAKRWYEILATIPKEKISIMKTFLDTHTLIGEYCGNQMYLHLVSYSQIELYFYAIVEKNGSDWCLPPEKAIEIFDQIGLRKCNFKRFDTQTLEEFYSKCKELFKQVSSSSIEEQGEGNVLYLVSEEFDQKSNKLVQKTVSLAKLKTLEYRIFRKIREKLKSFFAKKDFENILEKITNKFQSELKDLCKYFSPAKDIEYYMIIAKEAFEFLDKNHKTFDTNLVSSQFIKFLNKIREAVDSQQKLQVGQFLGIQQDLTQLEGSEEDPQQGEDNQETKEKISKRTLFSKPVQILVFTPPYFLSDQSREKIKETFQLKKISDHFRQEDLINQQITIFNLHTDFRFTKKELAQNTFVLIMGFDDNTIQTTKQFISEKKAKLIGQANQQSLPFLQSKNLDQIFDKILNFRVKLVKFLQENMPNNFLEIGSLAQLLADQAKSQEILASLQKISILQTQKPSQTTENQQESKPVNNKIEEEALLQQEQELTKESETLEKSSVQIDKTKEEQKEVHDQLQQQITSKEEVSVISKDESNLLKKENSNLSEKEDSDKRVQFVAKEDSQTKEQACDLPKIEHVTNSDFKKVSFSENLQIQENQIKQETLTNNQEIEVDETRKRSYIIDLLAGIAKSFLSIPANQDFLQPKPKVEQKPMKRYLIIVIFSCIPASGKTTFLSEYQTFNMKQANGFKLYLISSDDIRKGLMDQVEQKNGGKKLSSEELFNHTKKASVAEFRAQLQKKVQEIAQSDSSFNILFVDKNCPPAALSNSSEQLDLICPKSLICKKLLIKPFSSQDLIFDKAYFPFSLNYLLTCCLRNVKREHHQTLNGDDLKKTEVSFTFANLFRNQRFQEHNVKNFGFDKLTEIKFSNEDLELDEEIQKVALKLINQILFSQKPGKEIKNQMNQIYDFITLLYDIEPYFQKEENFYKISILQLAQIFSDLFKEMSTNL